MKSSRFNFLDRMISSHGKFNLLGVHQAQIVQLLDVQRLMNLISPGNGTCQESVKTIKWNKGCESTCMSKRFVCWEMLDEQERMIMPTDHALWNRTQCWKNNWKISCRLYLH